MGTSGTCLHSRSLSKQLKGPTFEYLDRLLYPERTCGGLPLLYKGKLSNTEVPMSVQTPDAILQETKRRMHASVEALKKEMATIRTGPGQCQPSRQRARGLLRVCSALEPDGHGVRS